MEKFAYTPTSNSRPHPATTAAPTSSDTKFTSTADGSYVLMEDATVTESGSPDGKRLGLCRLTLKEIQSGVVGNVDAAAWHEA